MRFEAFLPLIFVAIFLLLAGVAVVGALKQQRQAREQLAGLLEVVCDLAEVAEVYKV
jgi:hypothetical protein